jgi:uncharacterized protein
VKLQAERIEGTNAIARHSAEGVIVNAAEYRRSVIVPWQGAVQGWDVASFEQLSDEHFRTLIAFRPEIVIFGSGARLRFPKPALLRPLIDARIGIETMDTAAACRTYNVLLTESRSVLAALLFETP